MAGDGVRAPTAAHVEAALDTVCDPCSLAAGTPLGIVEMGLLRGWSFAGGALTATLCVTGPGCTFAGLLADRAQAALSALPGVDRVEVRLDPAVVWTEAAMRPAARERLAADRAARVRRLGVRPRMWEERE